MSWFKKKEGAQEHVDIPMTRETFEGFIESAYKDGYARGRADGEKIGKDEGLKIGYALAETKFQQEFVDFVHEADVQDEPEAVH